ncbi:fructose-6-phosphate aldolase [Gracilibacillus salitolerans]|uniref:Fructose-6-phosphate aldolase n=1 Tax=Gracilibacillus salitolerans TaxID=2663022 RepID=A0A5Q2TRE0_9BACI|nr:transaldolase family protein [Gracilibacillus salitolerans]QGH36657.1 fructose-6-phosphate aldolase [Gracilibacillus salitolerans]
MEIYLDTANPDHLQFASKFPFLNGITTNPSIIAKEKDSFKNVIKRINQHIQGKVWMQVTETTAEAMYQEAIELKNWVDHPVIKLPMNEDGLEAAYRLRQENIEVNMTLIYSLSQVVLAAKADVNYISPYIGRMDDQSLDGQTFIKHSKEIIQSFGASTKIIGASIRNTQVVADLARYGYDAITIPFPIFKKMFQSPLTTEGLAVFQSDWEKYTTSLK